MRSTSAPRSGPQREARARVVHGDDAGRRVWPAPGPAAIAAVGKGFVVAGYAVRDGHEQLFAVHVPARLAGPASARFQIDPPSPRAHRAAGSGRATRATWRLRFPTATVVY